MLLSRETQLLDQIDDLKEQVRYWQSEAQRESDAATNAKLSDRYALTRAEAWLVASLYAAKGMPVSRVRLCEGLPDKCRGEDSDVANVVNVLICRIRKKMGRESVETVLAIGYRLSARGLALCEEALA